METQAFPTTPLLRPDQVTAAKDEIASLEAKLSNKHIENKGEVHRQLKNAKLSFQNQVPLPPATAAEEDAMVKRSRALLSQIVQGMPSQEEMRKAPPGAVDKHLAWERMNKRRIAEWKHLQRRLTAGSGDTNAANIERHRPVTSTLNMDNAQIPGKQIFLPENPDGLGVTFSSEQLELLRKLSPDIADKIGSLTNRERGLVKQAMEGIGLEEPSPASVDRKSVV